MSTFAASTVPMTVLRRLDAVLEPTKQEVLNTKAFLDEHDIGSQDGPLREATGQAFYNTSESPSTTCEPRRAGSNSRLTSRPT